MKLAVIGTGYVGLVSGVCFASLGHHVTCVDIDEHKLTLLRSGTPPIYENGLDALISSGIQAQLLEFTSDIGTALKDTDIVIIAVGTPPDSDGNANLRYIYNAAEQIAQHIEEFTIIMTKSTVPVGTNRAIASRISQHIDSNSFSVVSNPEFLREGAAVDDFMHPDRIIIGVENDQAKTIIEQLYAPLIKKHEAPVLFTDLETAEMIKYASNSFLATKIAFINEMADICEKVSADVIQVAQGMGLDKRIGNRFLSPGPGYGGSCFPKDVQALSNLALQNGINPLIIRNVIQYNTDRKAQMVNKVIAACGGSVERKKLAILGLTFKAHTDDVRESPALTIIPALLNAGATITAYDPQGIDNAKPLLAKDIAYSEDAYSCAHSADVLVIITEWPEFAALDLEKLRDVMAYPCIVDMRNLYYPETMQKAGFDYYSVGRQAISGYQQHY